MQYFGFHLLNLFYVNSSFQNYKNKYGVTFKIVTLLQIFHWILLKYLKIFPKQAIGTISSSTRILSKEMMNALISFELLI